MRLRLVLCGSYLGCVSSAVRSVALSFAVSV
jgi:hypothetical protein